MNLKENYKIKLLEKNKIADETLELIFKKPENFVFKAGQYVYIKLKDNISAKAFSIASYPDENVLRFSMRESQSDFKKECLALKKGDIIEISKSFGNFSIKENGRKIVFLVSGIGITPVISILKDLEEKKFTKEINLFYSNRTINKAAYHNTILEMNLEKLKYRPVFTGIESRINIDLLKNSLLNLKEFYFYIVGTKDFIKTMIEMLETEGLKKEDYLIDNFG